MSGQKFPDRLEPLRVRRSWARDAALTRVGQLRRELASLRSSEERIAASALEEAAAARRAWTGAPDPQRRRVTVAWLAASEARQRAAKTGIAAAEARLQVALEAAERAHAALDAVERQTSKDRAAHARVQQAQAQSLADDDGLARRGDA